MVPAGIGDSIWVLIEHELIDVLIRTGSNKIHDLFDAFSDGVHYIGSPYVSDSDLFDEEINRI